MASYHCSVKTVSRSTGSSAVGSSAYRAAEKIVDERTGETHDYTKKQGVEHSEIILPYDGQMSRAELWNMAEKSEKRKNSTVAREYEVALPSELTPGQRKELAQEFAQHLAERYGVAVDLCIHAPGKRSDQRNHHAHLLTTTRQVTADGFGAKTRVLDDRKSGEVEHIRATWAQLTNKALARAGHQECVSYKSLKAQGIARKPSIHLGVAATAMERRGIQTDRGNENREARLMDTVKHDFTNALKVGKDRALQWFEDRKKQQELAKQKEQAAEQKRQAELDRQRQEKHEQQKSRGGMSR